MPLLVTAAEMRVTEADAVDRGETWEGLMEQAGAAVARLAVEWLGAQSEQRVLVLAGPGNNGGDALVVARHLHDHGWPVRCLIWARKTAPGDRLLAPLSARALDVTPLDTADFHSQLQEALAWSTIVVDGLLGIGLQRDIDSPLADIIKQVATSRVPVVAIDVPTGVDSDTGQVRGAVLPASFTVATGLMKYGHALEPGKSLAGEITIGEIKLSQATSRETAKGTRLTDDDIRKMLPERPEDANKGTFGKAMVVSGSVNYIGAAALATEGAMRSGAGLVTLACAGDLLPILAVKLTECTFLPLPSDLGAIAQTAADKLMSELKGYSALLVGCGLGKDKETAAFLRSLLSRPEESSHPGMRPIGFAARRVETKGKEQEKVELPPLVLDGDALNLLADWAEWAAHVPANSVLTPHPGEMARLTGLSVEEVQSDRVSVATEYAAKWNQVVVLKGAATVIAEPGGKVYVSPFSNPALSTAGTGDVLAGTIAGLRAQGLDSVKAACVGVYLHGLAGKILLAEYGPVGGLAGDLVRLMPRAQKVLREGSDG
ncbi:MAG: ADP-dependent NAD(P)H-hydrate dehydratase / NAD(P)H-hydrate epimerase [Chloroflexia bacterium]|jgi:NAD(P)H-hydrate epimerase|nr:ADP-dependent NAD(P)H-hydrate dehydratase / NAD(P)H-hydrate epimerase [Chloroflexia bacterium]